MIRARTLGSVVLVAAALAGPQSVRDGSAAPAQDVTYQWSRPGRAHPEVIAGVLSQASNAAPGAIAWSFLATRPAPLGTVDLSMLRESKVQALSRGHVVKLQQTWAGIDVVGAQVIVRIDDGGRVRWMSSTTRPLPSDFSTAPGFSPDAAIQVAYLGPAKHHLARQLDPANHVRLVIWAPPAADARLAYEVLLPGDLARLEAPRVIVDAQTGKVLWTENRVKTINEAHVFPQNPEATPNTVQAVLAGLPDQAADLQGVDIIGRNCIDHETCTDIGGFYIRMCELESTAVSSGAPNYDFLAYTEPGSDLEPEDTFAEVQMYYHANQVYEYFRGFGLINLQQHPMQVVANFRIPSDFNNLICFGPTSTAALGPLDNAAYFPAGGLGGSFPPEDMLIFGQGSGADLAWEGDVVYHEMGHALAATVNEVGVVVPDTYGLDTTPGGMSEGYADWFAGTFTNDPSIGEYSGPSFGLPGPIRDMDNTATCPNNLWGEVHEDSLPWTGGLWEARSGIAAGDLAAFDQAIYDSFSTITQFDTMVSMRAKTVAEIQTSIDAGTAAAVEAILNARGFDDCNNRVIDTAEVPVKDLLQLYGTDQIQVGIVPGPVQFSLEITEQSNTISVDIAQIQGAGGLGGGGSAPAIRLLVKPGDEPILWTWTQSSASHDAPLAGSVSGSGVGSVSGDFPPGTYHLMLANEGGTAFAQGISFAATTEELPTPDAGAGGDPDAGPGSEPDAGGTTSGDGDGDCGCVVGKPSSANLAAGLLVLGLASFLLVLTRRRR